MAESEDTGERDIEERHDADLRRLDHVLAEAGDVARPGRACIDHRGDAALLRIGVRIDAERCAAPIDMRMQIDQARHDEQPDHVALRLRSAKPLPDGRDLAAGECHVGLRLDALRRVEHDPVAQHEIEHAIASIKPPRFEATPYTARSGIATAARSLCHLHAFALSPRWSTLRAPSNGVLLDEAVRRHCSAGRRGVVRAGREPGPVRRYAGRPDRCPDRRQRTRPSLGPDVSSRRADAGHRAARPAAHRVQRRPPVQSDRRRPRGLRRRPGRPARRGARPEFRIERPRLPVLRRARRRRRLDRGRARPPQRRGHSDRERAGRLPPTAQSRAATAISARALSSRATARCS